MEKYKLKIIKLTDLEKISIILLCVLSLFLVLVKPDSSSSTKPSFVELTADEIISKFSFKGSLEDQYIIDNKYASLLYLNDNKNESHLIDLKSRKEVNVYSFLKKGMDENFNKKINELLLMKYPKFVVEALNKSTSYYHFKDTYLQIYYYNVPLETDRVFSLKVYYNELKDFLEFNPIISDTYENESGFIYDPNKVSVSITFDDGPNNERTVKLINALEDYKMSSTFFMVGYKMYSDENTVKYVSSSHSEVGYHSMNHNYFTKQSSADITNEFNIINDYFYNLTGKRITLTRPPYGAFNKTTLASIENAFIRWNVDTNDWRYKDVDYIFNHVTNNIDDGNIILFHDSYDTSVEAAIKVFEYLYLKDVQVLSISELAKLKGINLENHEVYFDFK